MKKVFPFIFAIILSLSAEAQTWEWKNERNGLQSMSASMTLFDSQQHISAIRFKAGRHKLQIVGDPAEDADSTSAMALRHGALAAINGSYFNVKKLTPVTYIKENGRVEGRTTQDEMFRVDGVVAIKGKHIDIFPCDTADYDSATRKYTYAMASGPVLLQDGKACKEKWPRSGFFSKRHPRTLMGTGADGWVYLIVIDGRFPGRGIGTTIAETVEVARLFGLENAINLDGGGSSVAWTLESGVLSHPYDNKRFDHYGQRVVPNIVMVK